MAGVKLDRRKDKFNALAEINMVPFIDVVLVLLIIFMVMSPLLVKMQERDIQVNLPVDSLNATLSTIDDLIAVNVRRNGSYVVRGNQVTVEEMTRIVTEGVALNKDKKVLIRGDQEALHGYVARAVAICRAAGIKEANIGYQVPQ
ncbi:MAG: biopolymer transporter ExbD [bacterium]|jgi:biopolymer transport protein ExbD